MLVQLFGDAAVAAQIESESPKTRRSVGHENTGRGGLARQGWLLGGMLWASAACGPSYQPEASQPVPPATPQHAAPAEPPGDTAPLARTPVPPDRPLEPRSLPAQAQVRPTPQPQASALEARFQAILDRHNQHRAKHCAAPLRWSRDLQAHAQAWADQLRDAGCAFEHRPDNRYGENLTFFAPVGSQRPEAIASGWYNEISSYDFSQGDFDFRTGHFTQVVWRGTQELGCGVSSCKGGEIWVCNYDPPGNMMGAFRENVQPTGCAR